MVFSVPFQCDMCNTIINLKIQADNSLFSYKYPMSLYCPKCGNPIDLTYDKSKGILPMNFRADERAKGDFELYYSAFLPIVDELHLKASSTISLTPYIFLTKYYDDQKIIDHNVVADRILTKVYPYRRIFKEIIPIYRKGNVIVFSKKNGKDI